MDLSNILPDSSDLLKGILFGAGVGAALGAGSVVVKNVSGKNKPSEKNLNTKTLNIRHFDNIIGHFHELERCFTATKEAKKVWEQSIDRLYSETDKALNIQVRQVRDNVKATRRDLATFGIHLVNIQKILKTMEMKVSETMKEKFKTFSSTFNQDLFEIYLEYKSNFPA